MLYNMFFPDRYFAVFTTWQSRTILLLSK